jgi:hypothetical protein
VPLPNECAPFKLDWCAAWVNVERLCKCPITHVRYRYLTYGGLVSNGVASSMQQSGYSPETSGFAGGAAGGAPASIITRQPIGIGIHLGAVSGALGAATANAVSGLLNLFNQDFGDCGCGR